MCDYTWMADLSVMVRHAVAACRSLRLRLRRAIRRRWGDFGPRARKKAGGVEAGVRFDGSAGAIELFAGFENRIDADPIDLMSQRWGLAGFRLVGK